tara:strand:+ start:3194 stop:4153 length:960 start_codon:yes stop_codon:yes gene_type:complete
MSKIKINEIEALSNNGDLDITPNGTGVFEVAGDGNDGTLQLNSASQTKSVKIKSPNDSAGQSYSLILPENNLTADKFLQVGTVTGSGATAVGQLQQATITPQDGTQLDAANLSSGSIDPNRVGDLPASSGFGLKLISKASVTQDDTTSSIIFDGLEDDSLYRIVLKNFIIKHTTSKPYTDSHSSGNVSQYPGFFFTDGNNQTYRYRMTANEFGGASGYGYMNSRSNQSSNGIIPYYYFPTGTARQEETLGGWINLSTKSGYGYAHVNAYAAQNEMKMFISFNYADTNNRIHSIGFVPTSYGFYFFGAGTELLLYKYIES